MDPMLNFRAPSDLTASLDAWIASQRDPRPSRSEAIQRLLAEALRKAADASSTAKKDSNAISDEAAVPQMPEDAAKKYDGLPM